MGETKEKTRIGNITFFLFFTRILGLGIKSAILTGKGDGIKGSCENRGRRGGGLVYFTLTQIGRGWGN